MRVLVACEFSGIVRDAFLNRGHDAISCDLLPTESTHYLSRSHHVVANVLDLITSHATWDRYDLMIAFPPCTHLAVSGARWFKDKPVEQAAAIDFFIALANAPIERIAIENPVGIMSTRYRQPDQIIQPWQFGHGETKATCLWLKNLPPLIPTHADAPLFGVSGITERVPRVHLEPPGPDRWKNRSRTYQGIADAMAEQWGKLANPL